MLHTMFNRIFSIFVFALVVPTAVAHAQVTLVSIITTFTRALAPLASVLVAVALVVFVWGMVVFTLNAGDEQARTTGRARMVWGVVGLFLIVAVWGIVALLGVVFGIDVDRTACRAPLILPDGTVDGCAD